MNLSTTLCIVIVFLGSFIDRSGNAQVSVRAVSDDPIEVAISSLRSNDVEQRTEAKKVLLANERESLRPLLSLYTRIRSGARIYGDEPATRNEDASADEIAKKEMERFDITDRLRQDVIDLLTQLRSEEALKAFIDYLYDYAPGLESFGEPVCGEMQALIEMRSLALPDIIEVLSTARHQAVRTRLNSTAEYYKSIRFQRRLITVLGRIGDPKALPLLEELASDEFLVTFVNEAERNILNNSRR